MDDKLIVVGCYIDEIRFEFCSGPIPDKFRVLHFGSKKETNRFNIGPQIWSCQEYIENPLTELELPDAQVSDKEFGAWISCYRTIINKQVANMMLEDANVNNT